MRPGEAKEIGSVNFWRYFVFQREGDGLFVAVRKQPYASGRRYCEELLDAQPTEQDAIEAAKKHMIRVRRAAKRMSGEWVPFSFRDRSSLL